MNQGKQLASDIKFYSGYSKYIEEEGRRESWIDSVNRVMNMHKNKFKEQYKSNVEFRDFFNFAHQQYLEKRVLASQRSLQWADEPLRKHNSRMFNCLTLYADKASFFQETMYWLLSGCGVGFSVQKKHIRSMPRLQSRTKGVKTFVIEDSMEGWADSIGVLISSFLEKDSTFSEYQGCRVDFDYSKIRKKGSKITGGFKAPGPEGLRKAHLKIEQMLEQYLENTKQPAPFKSILIYDIVMHSSDAVLSGGVRRSATICLFSVGDEDMLNAKTGNWFITNPQRARSNNSVVLVRDKVTREEFAHIVKSVKEFGEPGFVWSSDEDILYNPCITLESWVTTPSGPKQVKDLIGEGQVDLILDGQAVSTSEEGFIQTGVKPVYKLTLDNGMTIRATGNHQILTSEGWVECKDLTDKDFVQLPDNTSLIQNSYPETTLFKEGWLIGNLIGDGTYSPGGCCKWNYWDEEKCVNLICKQYLSDIDSKLDTKINREYERSLGLIEQTTTDSRTAHTYSLRFGRYIEQQYGIRRGIRQITDPLEKADFEITRGVIAGLFDSDGLVWGNSTKTVTIGITQTNRQTLEAVQRILIRQGIPSRITIEQLEGPQILPDGKGGEKEYWCNTAYRLYILGRYNVSNFFKVFTPKNLVKLKTYEEIEALYVKSPYKTKSNFLSRVESVIPDGVEPVYDCHVPTYEKFEANGMVVHNCVEIGMVPKFLVQTLEDAEELGVNIGEWVTGAQGCNLTEINGAIIKTRQDFLNACIASAVIGTLQASYTDFRYVSPVNKKIFDKEALLGGSITGWMDNAQILFNEELLEEGAKLILEINKKVAKIIGINPAARATCTKPAGNSSVILGCGSGIHGEHSPKHFRNMQFNKDEDIVKHIKNINPEMVEESVWSANKTDWVVSIPIEVDKSSRFKESLLGVKQLEYVKKAQKHWVEPATRKELCTIPSARHNISNTTLVDDWEEVEQYIWDNKKYFAGISLLNITGDRDYPQAPFTAVYTSKEIVKMYGDAALYASGLIVDGLDAFENNLWAGCSAVLGQGTKLSYTKEEVEQEIEEGDIKILWENLGMQGRALNALVKVGEKPDVVDYKEYMDSRIRSTIFKAYEKADWVRRAKSFANKFFKGDLVKMTYCLKDVYNNHKWDKITRTMKEIDWQSLDLPPSYVEVDQIGAIACSGINGCEI